MRIRNVKRIPYTGPVYNLEVEETHNYFANGVLVGNCHQAKAVSLQEIAKKCVNAEYRIGFTGTLPKEKADLLTIYGYLGPQEYEIKSDVLIDKGILSQISVANLILKYPKILCEECFKTDYDGEVEIVESYPRRNRIFKWIFTHLPDNQNSLILVTHIDHLKKIKEYLEKELDKKYKVYEIHGEIKQEDREHIRHLTEKESNIILLATYKTMSTGVNIKRLHNVIAGSSLKALITIQQSIGRGLRLHETKEQLVWWDIIDDLSYMHPLTRGPHKGEIRLEHNYCYNHFLERMDIYTNNSFQCFSKEFDISTL